VRCGLDETQATNPVHRSLRDLLRRSPSPPFSQPHAQYSADAIKQRSCTEAYGFRGQGWPCHHVVKVIEQEFGVTYSAWHIARLLKGLPWTPHHPVERASQRDERANAYGHTRAWPDLKKGDFGTAHAAFYGRKRIFPVAGLGADIGADGADACLSVFQTHDRPAVMTAITLSGRMFTLTRPVCLTEMERALFLNHQHTPL